MPPRTIIPRDIEPWWQRIGQLIINFGGIEFESLRWISLLGSKETANDASGIKLSQRITLVTELLESSPLSEAAKSRARELWAEVRELVQTRNRVAHNPIVVGPPEGTGEPTLGVIDLREMAWTGGQNDLEPLHHTQIETAAVRASEISNKLSAIALSRA